MAYMIKNSETRRDNKVSRTIIIIFPLQTKLALFQECFLSFTDYDTKKTEPSKKEHTQNVIIILLTLEQRSAN